MATGPPNQVRPVLLQRVSQLCRSTRSRVTNRTDEPAEAGGLVDSGDLQAVMHAVTACGNGEATTGIILC